MKICTNVHFDMLFEIGYGGILNFLWKGQKKTKKAKRGQNLASFKKMLITSLTMQLEKQKSDAAKKLIPIMFWSQKQPKGTKFGPFKKCLYLD